MAVEVAGERYLTGLSVNRGFVDVKRRGIHCSDYWIRGRAHSLRIVIVPGL